MMSLSKEWAILSRAMYGQEFIDELAQFLKEQGVKTILECGCGDGNVLWGLAKKGFRGVGIDGSLEMIQIANAKYQHSGIEYKHLNWLDLEKISGQYDCVLCRGNSLSYVLNWDGLTQEQPLIDVAVSRSIGLMFERLRAGGLLYLDTVRQEDIDRGNREIEIKYPEIRLIGKIEYNFKRKLRRTYGKGVLFGEDFSGGAESVFISPRELTGILKRFRPSKIWSPQIKGEINYHVICAQK